MIENITLYPWQQETWLELEKTIKMQKLPHSIALLGEAGLGKLNFAKYLAQRLFCKTACGTCKQCRLLQAGNHPDFIPLYLEAENNTHKIDNIRELIETLQQTPQVADKQVVIIDQAEKMNRSAANALLKTLEEPPGNVIFILIVNNRQLLPATILSRCQQIKFQIPAMEVSLEWLKQFIKDEFEASLLLNVTDMLPLTAQAMHQEDFMTKRHALIKIFLGNMKQHQEISEKDYSFDLLMKILYSLSLDFLRIYTGNKVVANKDFYDDLNQVIAWLDINKLLGFVDQLIQTKAFLLHGGNLNEALLIQETVINWQQLFNKGKIHVS